MRLVIDLQGAQGASRHRGKGRLSRELALAMVRNARGHDPVILLNEAVTGETERLFELFSALLPRENIRTWKGLSGCGEIGGDPATRRASEMLRAQVLTGLRPDLVHVSSVMEGVSDDAVTVWPSSLQRLPLVATFYDAIPLIRREEYLNGVWRGIAPWFYRHTEELRLCDALLAISESARAEAVDWIGYAPDRVFNMRAGFDQEMFRPCVLTDNERDALFRRYGLRLGFILLVSAVDERKNDRRLAEAYAALPPAVQAAHQLVIVGSARETELRGIMEAAGVPPSCLILLRSVPDSDLPALYSLCHASTMPSEHEGFGLPALEAMACGAPVIASNVTSLPEVVGLEEALFDPYDIADIRGRLHQVLTDETFRQRLADHGLKRSAEFGWDASARLAWEALEEVHDRRATGQSMVLGSVPILASGVDIVPNRKPTLACVGPLPPDETGIADYTRDLLPDLARHYDITLVTRTGSTSDPVLAALFPVIDEATFDHVAQGFDRILFQVGNSQFHLDAVTRLLPRHPGVVVLHDAFLSNIPFLSFLASGDRDRLARDLFDSHGWPAVRALEEEAPVAASRRFPCSLPVFRNALGVIQHSAHARDLAIRYFGKAVGERVALVPLTRGPALLLSRAEARRALGVPEDVVLCCTFGIVADTKKPVEVLEAWHRGMVNIPGARLAYVGAIGPEWVDALMTRARELDIDPAQIVLTGRIGDDGYDKWLSAADFAIQLRCKTRGETSRAVVDCLGAGLPLVVNAHGSAAELPPDALMLLPDDADVETIGKAIRTLWAHPEQRAVLSNRAREHVRDELAPLCIAALYRNAIESAWTTGPSAPLFAATEGMLKAQSVGKGVDEAALPGIAQALVRSFPELSPRRLLLDASNMAKRDLGTGIQRVIREISRRVLDGLPDSWRGDMTRMDCKKLYYARNFAAKLLALPAYGLKDGPVEAGPGDILVLMDHHGNMTDAEFASICRQQRQGARIVLVVYDILPLRHPKWFPPAALSALRRWPELTLSVADAVICISRAVADDVMAWLDEGNCQRTRPLDVGYFPLGADFSVRSSAEAPTVSEGILEAICVRPSLLMVGTIEPRKGHAQALAAFERCWAEGYDLGLTIVGKPGWMVDGLLERLRTHPELGHRLQWLQYPSDEELQNLYASHASLLLASEGEGFGLPLVEAALHGMPILARDLPVFREIAGDHAMWFSGTTPEALALALQKWLEAWRAGSLPSSAQIAVATWDESVKAFLKPLLTDVWPLQWNPQI